MSSEFEGQVVLVAGGTGALGRAVSASFLDAGATVIVTYRRESEFDALKGAVGPSAIRLDGYRVDVMNESELADAIGDLVVRHGRLDVLINAIGGYSAGAPLWEMEASVLERMLSMNLHPGYRLARAVVPIMLKRGRGALVNVAATAAFNHMPSAGAYVASKAAAVAMIDSLAADLRGSGVRVNSICPTIIDTEANRAAMPGVDYSGVAKARGNCSRDLVSVRQQCQADPRRCHSSVRFMATISECCQNIPVTAIAQAARCIRRDPGMT